MLPGSQISATCDVTVDVEKNLTLGMNFSRSLAEPGNALNFFALSSYLQALMKLQAHSLNKPFPVH
jgi:hypothetical protein